MKTSLLFAKRKKEKENEKNEFSGIMHLRRVFLDDVLDVGTIFEAKFQYVVAQNMSF